MADGCGNSERDRCALPARRCGPERTEARPIFTATAKCTQDALWIAEEAAASGAFSGLILELRGNPRGLGLDDAICHTAVPAARGRRGRTDSRTLPPCGWSRARRAVPLRDGPLSGSDGAAAFEITIEKPAPRRRALHSGAVPHAPELPKNIPFRARAGHRPHTGAGHHLSPTDRLLGPRLAQARAS